MSARAAARAARECPPPIPSPPPPRAQPPRPATETDTETTGSIPCDDDDDCMTRGAPFCGPAGECTDCDGMNDPDAACAGLDEGTPACVDGACVQCTDAIATECDGTTPICDDEQNLCVPCTEHAQCEDSGACDIAEGDCFTTDQEMHVDGDGGQDFTTITAAVASVGAAGQALIIIHDAAGDYNGRGRHRPNQDPRPLRRPRRRTTMGANGWRQPNGNDRRNGLPPRLALDGQHQHHRPRGQHPRRPGVAGPRQGRRQRRRRHRRERVRRPRPGELVRGRAVSTTCTHWRSPARVRTCCTRR